METNALVGRSSASDVWMRGLFMLLLMIGFGTGQWLLGRLRAVFRRELGDDAPEGCSHTLGRPVFVSPPVFFCFGLRSVVRAKSRRTVLATAHWSHNAMLAFANSFERGSQHANAGRRRPRCTSSRPGTR